MTVIRDAARLRVLGSLVIVALVSVSLASPAVAAASWRTLLADGPIARESRAEALSVRPMAADDDIPGVALPSSPVAGTLDAAGDTDDVFSITLGVNDLLMIDLNGPAKTRFGIYVYGPGATTVQPGAPGYDADTLVDYSAYGAYPETIMLWAPVAGTYYIDLYADSGAGAYQMEWVVYPGEPNDSMSTCPTISPSPQLGTFSTDEWDMGDIYKLELAEGDQLSLVLSSPDALSDLDLQLYSPWAESSQGMTPPRAYSWKLDTSDERVTFLVPPGGGGTYYIEVSDWAGYGGSYALNWTVAHPKAPRISGANRYETSYAISRSSFTTCTAAVLATGADYPDALAASGLAGAVGGPVLLVQPGKDLYDAEGLYMELWGLEVTDVYIVGGTSAISESFEEQLEWDGFNVVRVSGKDRYATAAAVADKIDTITGLAASDAFLVSGVGFADALSAAPYAYANAFPVLLTKPTGLSSATNSYVAMHPGITIHLVGGDAALSDEVEQKVAEMLAVPPVRIEGRDRYVTSANLAEYAIDTRGWASWTTMGIATGLGFPDALSGGAACGARGGGLLLTKPTTLSPACAGCLQGHASHVDHGLVFGGPGAVSDAVLVAIEAALE